MLFESSYAPGFISGIASKTCFLESNPARSGYPDDSRKNIFEDYKINYKQDNLVICRKQFWPQRGNKG